MIRIKMYEYVTYYLGAKSNYHLLIVNIICYENRILVLFLCKKTHVFSNSKVKKKILEENPMNAFYLSIIWKMLKSKYHVLYED